MADRRLRLALLRRAVEQAGAVLASGPEQQAALAHWLAVDAEVLAPADAAAHERLYETLI